MGILKDCAVMIRALPLGKGFTVCELGDQLLSYTNPPRPAEELYRELGCGRYVSIDGNGKGTVTADLNTPLAALKLGTFDLVTDFGTSEHIFDQAQVWRTMHDLTKPGGYIVFDRPHQGYTEHCFYCVNATLFQDLAQANGYNMLRLEQKETPRGSLLRGVYQRPVKVMAFQVPQQRRYHASLVVR